MKRKENILMIKPFLLKAGNKTVFKGTRSQCLSKSLSKKIKANGDLRLVPNPRFGWIKEKKG